MRRVWLALVHWHLVCIPWVTAANSKLHCHSYNRWKATKLPASIIINHHPTTASTDNPNPLVATLFNQIVSVATPSLVCSSVCLCRYVLWCSDPLDVVVHSSIHCLPLHVPARCWPLKSSCYLHTPLVSALFKLENGFCVAIWYQFDSDYDGLFIDYPMEDVNYWHRCFGSVRVQRSVRMHNTFQRFCCIRNANALQLAIQCLWINAILATLSPNPCLVHSYTRVLRSIILVIQFLCLMVCKCRVFAE